MRRVTLNLSVVLLAALPLSAPAVGAPQRSVAAAKPVEALGAPRWTIPQSGALRVHIAPGDPIEGWTPAHDSVAWVAFASWQSGELPFRFVREPNAADAHVIVSWVARLPGTYIGQTRVQEVGDEIVRGRITLALSDDRGHPIARDIQRGAILHEVGHVLGLSHAADTRSVMYRQVWTTDLSAADHAAIRTLYGRRLATAE